MSNKKDYYIDYVDPIHDIIVWERNFDIFCRDFEKHNQREMTDAEMERFEHVVYSLEVLRARMYDRLHEELSKHTFSRIRTQLREYRQEVNQDWNEFDQEEMDLMERFLAENPVPPQYE